MNVIVTVTEVNEAPLFKEDAPTVLRVRENTDPPVFTLDDGDTLVRPKTYAATDQDGGNTCCTYSVTGVDRSAFAIDSTIFEMWMGLSACGRIPFNPILG